MAASGQKFIAGNRAPRVQIEYEVETYGSERKVELPFVMGVLADLSGKSRRAEQDPARRRFFEIDIDNFDQCMKALAPRAAFVVPDTLGGKGQMLVDITFESLDDFAPAAIATKVGALRRLLELRTQLANLQTYMDGKAGAEGLVRSLLQNKALLRALAAPAAAAAATSGTSGTSGTPATRD